MSKQNLFIDFDDTIVNSSKAFCKVYNKMFKNHKNFKEANYKKINRWDYKDECPLIERADIIFAMEDLFEELEFFENAYETLYKLKDKYNIIICSTGTLGNIAYKAKWINQHLPFVKNIILLGRIPGGNFTGKSEIDMKKAIFIDDNANNLMSTNADKKICFGEIHTWNEKWTKSRFTNWYDIQDYLEFNLKNK